MEIKEFVQEFRRTARESDYERRLLIEDFKRGINQKKVKYSLRSIEQWYKRAKNLDRHQKKNRQEKERLREIRETGTQMLGINILENAKEVQQQQLFQP